MIELVKFLQETAKTGEVVTIAYCGGSRPGEARNLVIISCSNISFRAYEDGFPQAKQYNIQKVLWVENSAGKKIINTDDVQTFDPILPTFETLDEYVDLLRNEFENAGWYIHRSDNSFGVGTYFKNGKPKNTPSIAICYFDQSTDIAWDLETGECIDLQKETTGRERPWRVDSWQLKQGRCFGLLHSAMKLFIKEVRSSNPQQAKGMFAGH